MKVLVFIQVAFLHIQEVVLFLQFTALVVYIRDIMVVNVDHAFALLDFVTSKYFYF